MLRMLEERGDLDMGSTVVNDYFFKPDGDVKEISRYVQPVN